MDPLVSTAWLADRLHEDGVTVVDSSWHMPNSGREGREDYLARRIPGARFLDIDAVSDRDDPAPHMLPAAENFAAAMERIGIGSEGRIIVYDYSPLRTAARGWFMLRHFGARNVAILDGGLGKWLAEGRPTEAGEPPARSARFVADPRSDVAAKADLLGRPAATLIDARSAARFTGSEADPRPGIAAGHMPGALNLPYAALYNPDGTFRPAEEIAGLFAASGADAGSPFIATCGSGVTANSLIFAALLAAGNAQAKLYDGSWAQWGADPATPKVVG